jgi:hypothetical protein
MTINVLDVSSLMLMIHHHIELIRSRSLTRPHTLTLDFSGCDDVR